MIELRGGLMTEAMSCYRSFISYSRKDAKFAAQECFPVALRRQVSPAHLAGEILEDIVG